MNVSVGSRWESFVEETVRSGRYGSASEVVREGLRLVEEREAKLRALRATLEASIAAGGEVSDAELDEALAEGDAGLARGERRERMRQDALGAWAAYRATGLHATAEEVDAWLAKLEAGEDADPPACHP